MALIHTQDFNKKARAELLHLLGSVPGRKNLVLQKSLVGRIELLLKFSTLQDQGIDRIFFLENDNVDSSQRNVIFIVSGEKTHVSQAITAQIKRLQQTASTDHDFTILWVPRKTLVGEKIFVGAGILGDVTSLEWSLCFHALEEDLISMELDDSFGELCLRHDPTSIFLAAKALNVMQQEHGLFPRILGKGDNAKWLAELIVRLRPEAASSQKSGQSKRHAIGSMPSITIENLIIIDREVDMATPLMTQLTYEGLIDEVFEIKNSQAEVSATVIGQSNTQSSGTSSSDRPSSQSQSQGLKRKIRLDSTDTLYSTLRNSNFAILGSQLNRVARRLQTDYAGYGSTSTSQKTVAELKDLVHKLPGYQTESQSLKIHTGLAEEIMNTTRSETFMKSLEVQQNVIAGTDPSSLLDILEDLIARECPLHTALRLLCLCSIVNNGLRKSDFDSIRRQILHAYGHQHLTTLSHLEKMGLLTARAGLGVGFGFSTASTTATATTAQRTDYATLRRSLNLILDDVDEENPSDIAYTFSGYAPLSVRLVQCILQKPYLSSLLKSVSGNIPATSSTANTTFTEASSGWRPFEDLLKSVKGATFDIEQKAEDRSAKARQRLVGSGRAGDGSGGGAGARKVSIVFFLGGVTFAEVAALRFVAGQEKGRREILIATTGIMKGDSVVGAARAGVPGGV